MRLINFLKGLLIPEVETYRLTRGKTRYTISEKGSKRFLKVNGVIYSELDKKSLYLGSYHDYFLPLPSIYGKSKILMLGLGAGTIPFYLSKLYGSKVSIDVVEIDKDYLDLTKRFLPAGSINFKIIIGDGAEFVRKSKNKYDIIRQDVYERGVRIPGQFLGKKFIGAAYDALTDDGMLAINFAPDVIYLPVYLHKLRKSFGHVYRISHIRFANYIILCSKKLDKRQMLRLVESKMKMNEGNRSLLKAYRSMR